MRGPDRKPRKLRPAPVRDGLVPSRAVPKHIRRARWAAKAVAEGRCVSCGKDRGAKGTSRLCRRCANRHAKRQRAYQRGGK